MTNEAQVGMSRILRPPSNFVTLYEGQPASTQPIYLFPDGEQLDAVAGEPGYDPNLVNALRVPFGAQIEIWVPILIYVGEVDPIVSYSYKWRPIWRMRNPFDFKQDQKSYHNAQGQGTSDTSSGAASPRVVIPAANSTLIYPNAVTPSAASPDATPGVNNVRIEESIFGGASLAGPIVSAGVEGAIQQGIEDPGTVVGATRPRFMVYTVMAQGDELLLAVYRDAHDAPNWGFTEGVFPAQSDLPFQRFFANTNTGVYVNVMSADGFLTPRSPIT